MAWRKKWGQATNGRTDKEKRKQDLPRGHRLGEAYFRQVPIGLCEYGCKQIL